MVNHACQKERHKHKDKKKKKKKDGDTNGDAHGKSLLLSLFASLCVISLKAIWVLAQVYFKFVVQSNGCSFIWREVNL